MLTLEVKRNNHFVKTVLLDEADYIQMTKVQKGEVLSQALE